MGSATQNWSTKQVEIVCGQEPCNIQDPESKSKIQKTNFKIQIIQDPKSKIPKYKVPKNPNSSGQHF